MRRLDISQFADPAPLDPCDEQTHGPVISHARVPVADATRCIGFSVSRPVYRRPSGTGGVLPASRMPAASQAQPPAFAGRVIVLGPQRVDRPDARLPEFGRGRNHHGRLWRQRLVVSPTSSYPPPDSSGQETAV